jgi:hypothetical protein
MIPDAVVSHISPGRMRIKIASKKGDAAYFSLLKEFFSKCNGIERLEVNPLTGSVLFLHNLDVKAIAEYALKNNIFIFNEAVTRRTVLHRSLSEVFAGINSRIERFTGGDMDLSGTALLALLGLGVFQIGRGNFAAPAWYVAFWYAYNIFMKSNSNKGEG